MRKVSVLLILIIVICTVSLYAEDYEEPEFVSIVGPRIGASYYFSSSEDFTEIVNDMYDGDYYPFYTVFGAIAEQRVLLGETQSHFAVQEMVLIGGLEQSIAIPIFAVLMGYRDASGFEFGFGPLLSLTGIGVVAAVGWTFSYKGVFVPVDFHVILPNKERPAVIGLTTGFNFVIKRDKK